MCSLWIDWPYCTSSFCFRPWMPIDFLVTFELECHFSSSLYSFCALALKFNAWLRSFSHHYIVVLYLHCCALAIVPSGILHLLQAFNCGEANCVHVFRFNVWHLIIVASCTFYYIYSFTIWFTSFFFCFFLFSCLSYSGFYYYILIKYVFFSFDVWQSLFHCHNFYRSSHILLSSYYISCFVHVIESCCDGCQKGYKHLKTIWSFGSTTSNSIVFSLLKLLSIDQIF
jgi:hypothetical protein